MHSTFSSLTLVIVFLSFLSCVSGWPALFNGLNKFNRRQSDSSSAISYYTTIYNTETMTDTFTETLTPTLSATDTVTTTMGSLSFTGAADSGAPLTPEPSTTPTPEPSTTTPPLDTGSPSFTSAPDSGAPFPQTSNSTYSLIATAPPSPTGIVCVENDILQALQNFSIDATPFCSSYLSIPLYTVTSDSATVYAATTTTITEPLIDATSTTTIVSATVTSTTTVIALHKRDPEPTPAPALDAFAQSSLSALESQCSTETALITSLSAACSCLFIKPSTQTIYATASVTTTVIAIQYVYMTVETTDFTGVSTVITTQTLYPGPNVTYTTSSTSSLPSSSNSTSLTASSASLPSISSSMPYISGTFTNTNFPESGVPLSPSNTTFTLYPNTTETVTPVTTATEITTSVTTSLIDINGTITSITSFAVTVVVTPSSVSPTGNLSSSSTPTTGPSSSGVTNTTSYGTSGLPVTTSPTLPSNITSYTGLPSFPTAPDSGFPPTTSTPFPNTTITLLPNLTETIVVTTSTTTTVVNNITATSITNVTGTATVTLLPPPLNLSSTSVSGLPSSSFNLTAYSTSSVPIPLSISSGTGGTPLSSGYPNITSPAASEPTTSIPVATTTTSSPSITPIPYTNSSLSSMITGYPTPPYSGAPPDSRSLLTYSTSGNTSYPYYIPVALSTVYTTVETLQTIITTGSTVITSYVTETVLETVYVTITSVSTDFITNAYTVTITQSAVYPSGTGEYYYSASPLDQPTKRAVPAVLNVPRVRKAVRALNEE